MLDPQTLAIKTSEILDPEKITPGPWAFIAGGALAIGMLIIGVLAVRRIRRAQMRDEIRAQIAEELKQQKHKPAK